MAQAMASVAGLRGSSQVVLEGSLQLNGSTRLNVANSNNNRVSLTRQGLDVICKQHVSSEAETSRRAVIAIFAAGLATGSFAQAVLADAKPIKVGPPPPPPSGGLHKKEWPYVQNNLRLKAEYLRYDLNTVISAKPKDEKKALKDLTGKLFLTMSELDHAAKVKSTPQAEKYYAETVTTLNDVLAKLG